MRLYIPVFFSLVISSLVCAQNPPALKLPEGPLLNRVTAPAAWTITTQGADATSSTGASIGNSAPSSKSTNPRITSVVKYQNLVFEKVLTENGTSTETWRAENLDVMNQNKGGWFISPGVGNTFNTTDYSKADFAGFDWISLANFSGPRDVNGKHCITFKSQVITLDPLVLAILRSDYQNRLMAKYASDQKAGKTTDTSAPAFDPNSFKVDVEADIDNETRLPVQLIYKDQDGKTVMRSYIFQPPPAQLSPPPEVEKLLQNFQDHARRVTTGPAPI